MARVATERDGGARGPLEEVEPAIDQGDGVPGACVVYRCTNVGENGVGENVDGGCNGHYVMPSNLKLIRGKRKKEFERVENFVVINDSLSSLPTNPFIN